MIGDRIRELRERRSWTQAHLADAAGVSLRTIQRLETVHSCSPETLLALASALDVDVRELTDQRVAAARDPERLLWNGPDLRRAARWGILLVLPAIAFIALNLLKYSLDIPEPYDFASEAGAALGLQTLFEAASPWVLLGGPLAALVVNLAATARPRVRPASTGVSLIALDFRINMLGAAVMVAALASLITLGTYLVVENLSHVARGAP